jgi:hypothetical protein
MSLSEHQDQISADKLSNNMEVHHINFLELLAIFLSLKTFFTHKKSLHIGIRSDNTTAVAYVNDMGGMTSILLDNLYSIGKQKDLYQVERNDCKFYEKFHFSTSTQSNP